MSALIGTDVVIVGSGPAGCAAAARLVGEGRSVTLMEAGPGMPYPPSVSSLDALRAVDAEGRLWPDVSWSAGGDGNHGGGKGRGRYEIGRGVGGGAAVNSMVLTVGDRAEYDDWAAQTGDDRWTWASLEPAYRLLTERLPMRSAEPGPLGAAIAAAYGATSDSQPGSATVDARGVLAATTAVGPTGRVSPLDALLRTEPGGPLHPDLDLRVGAQVRRVMVARDGAAVGVELQDGTRVGSSSVVLCAGALQSPTLLGSALLTMAPPERWPVMDHPSFTFTLALRPLARLGPEQRPPVSVVVRCGSERDASASQGAADVLVNVLDHVGPGSEGRHYGAVVVALATPTSVGSVAASNSGLQVEPGWLVDEGDGAAMVGAVRLVASWLSASAVEQVADAVYLDDAGTPLAAMANWSDEELLSWLRHHPGPVRHPTSSLSPLVGPGPPWATSYADLCEQWPRGLVVADASVLPRVPSVNPQLPVMMAAWRLAADA